MKKLFHGTTKVNYAKIAKEGFKPNSKTWICSNDSLIYFYDTDKSDCDYDKNTDCINNAFESAKITAALQGQLDTELIVFEIDIEDKYVEDDGSCINMDTIASEVHIDDLAEYGKVKNIYKSNSYNPHLRLFYIANLVRNNEYINSNILSDLERRACEIIPSDNEIIEDLYNLDWENANIELSLK